MNGDAQRPMNLPPIPVGAAGSVRLPSGLYVSVPFRLYKYVAPDLRRIQDVLVDGKVYFASPSTFNDPADCLPVPNPEDLKNLPDRFPSVVQNFAKRKGVPEAEMINRYQQRMAETKGRISYPRADGARREENFGVFCLCERHDDVRMWAHYADNHCGVCYVFDFAGYSSDKASDFFPFECLLPVEYVEQKPFLDTSSLSTICCKSKEWESEREWRMIMSDDRYKSGVSDDAFSHIRRGAGAYEMHGNRLLGVILGYRVSKDNKARIVKMSDSKGMEIWEVVPKTCEYGLDVKPLNDRAQAEQLGKLRDADSAVSAD